jgi:hypothetical protein
VFVFSRHAYYITQTEQTWSQFRVLCTIGGGMFHFAVVSALRLNCLPASACWNVSYQFFIILLLLLFGAFFHSCLLWFITVLYVELSFVFLYLTFFPCVSSFLSFS